MHFSQPLFFWLLLLLPLALVLAIARERFSRHLRHTFSVPPTTAWRWRSVTRMTTGCLTLLVLIIALSGPQFWAMQKDDPRHHLKLAIGVDVSKSMLAEDVPPSDGLSEMATIANRLNAANLFALRLVEELAGEQAGLFFFARNGIEAVAPTRDQGFLRYMVRHTRLADLTESGSDLKTAMFTGATLLEDGNNQTAGAVILISDGEDTENTLQELIGQAEQMAGKNLPVYTIGIGQTEEVYIPVRRPGSERIDGFYTDTEGRHLRTRLQNATLQTIADKSGGRYFSMSDSAPRSLARHLLTLIPDSAKREEPVPRSRALKDLAPLLVALGLVSYIAHCLL